MFAVRRHRAAAFTAVVAVVLAAVTACGSAENATGSTVGSSPAAAAQIGFSSLLDASSLTATLKLDTDPATLVALSGAHPGATPLSTERAAAITGGSLVLAARTGGSFAQPSGTDGAFALTLNAGGTPHLVQVVVDGTTLYARAAVVPLLRLVGGADAQQVTPLLSSAVVPPQLAFLKSAVAGDWLTLNVSDAQRLLGASGPAAAPSAGPNRAAALLASLGKVFRDDVTVTRAATDPTLGDHLVLSGNARTVGTDLLAAVKAISGASTLLGAVTPSSLPDKQIRVDEYVKDGVVSALRIDLTQLLDAQQATAAGGRPVVLELDLTPSATITVPTQAVAVDPAALSGLARLLGVSGLGSALGSAGSAP